jgi:hypothetical protein
MAAARSTKLGMRSSSSWRHAQAHGRRPSQRLGLDLGFLASTDSSIAGAINMAGLSRGGSLAILGSAYWGLIYGDGDSSVSGSNGTLHEGRGAAMHESMMMVHFQRRRRRPHMSGRGQRPQR